MSTNNLNHCTQKKSSTPLPPHHCDCLCSPCGLPCASYLRAPSVFPVLCEAPNRRRSDRSWHMKLLRLQPSKLHWKLRLLQVAMPRLPRARSRSKVEQQQSTPQRLMVDHQSISKGQLQPWSLGPKCALALQQSQPRHATIMVAPSIRRGQKGLSASSSGRVWKERT